MRATSIKKKPAKSKNRLHTLNRHLGPKIRVIGSKHDAPTHRVTLCHLIADGSLTLNFVTVYHFLSCDNARRTA